MDIESVLNEWGVEDASIIASFKDNQIGPDDLIMLSDGDLLQLVPFIGPRNRIKANIALVKVANTSPSTTSSDDQGNKDSANTSIEQSRIVLSEKATDLLDEIIQHSETEDNVDTTNNNESIEPSKRAQPSKRPFGVFHDYDLKEILQQSPKGRFVLNQFQSHKKLVDSHRNKLCDVIINHEMKGNLDKRLSRERTNFLAEQVTDLFPSELLSTWYRVEDRPNQDGSVVKGRLITRFYTVRRTLINHGMVEENDEEEENDDNAMDTSEENEEVAEALAWLKSKNVSPWTRVLTAWQTTSKSRIAKLQAPIVADECSSRRKSKKVAKKSKTNDDKVFTYTADFPQIYQPSGWHLLEMDFEIYKPDALLKLNVEYPKLERFVLSKLKELDRDKLNDDFDQKTADEKAIFTFREFSRLFPVTTLTHNRSGEKGNWRTSKQEMKDGFLLHVNNRGQLKEALKTRQAKLSRFGFTDQPLPVIVEAGKNKQCLVIFDKTEYEVESPLKAVDVAFKSHHALHANYPVESECMWMFLQKAIYKFETKWDKSINAVDVLVGEFNSFQV